jgi:hypothetical protein
MSPRTKILLGILIAVLAFSARILPGPRTIDDAFITFRYARNLLEGNGPVFNPGQRVLGSTTPLYMGILAAVALPLGGSAAPFPEIALLINAFADALTCLLLIRVGSSLHSPAAGWAAALLWAVSPMSVTFAAGGLETSVYILLLISVLYCRLRGKLNAMSVLAGLAFLTRPDALILVALIWAELAFSFLRQNGFRTGLGKLFRASLPFLLIVIGWSTFAVFYYGTLLPNSMLAKSVVYRMGPGAGLIRMIQQYGTPFFEQLTFGSRILIITGPLYLFLSILGIYSAEKLRPGAGAAAGLAFPWLYFVVFSAANPLIFRWYLAPPLPFLFLSIFVGLATLLGLLQPGMPGMGARKVIASLSSRLPSRLSSRLSSRRGDSGDKGESGGDQSERSNFLLPDKKSGWLDRLVSRVRLTVPTPMSSADKPDQEKRPDVLRRALFAALTAAALLLSLSEWKVSPDHGPARPAPEMAYIRLELLYRQVAEDLQARILPGYTVAAGDVGVLGYYLDAKILDTVGLNSPEAIRYYPLPKSMYTILYAMPPDLILAARPEIVIFLEIYGRTGLLKDSRFLEEYRKCGEYPTDIYGSYSLLVYCRKDLP